MAHPQSRAPIVLSLALLLAAGCKDNPTIPILGEEVGHSRRQMTTEDSAAFLESRSAASGVATASSVSSIALQSGDSIVVTITSTECSGNPETVRVYGVISGVVAASSCAGLIGTQVTMGPATGDGTISFTATHQVYGEGPAGNVTGADPDYTVGLNDGYGDTDFNDVILNVRVVPVVPRLSCTPTPTRGGNVTCTVSGTGVAVTGWSFTGPGYNGSGFHSVNGPTNGNTWEGTAVASGTVSAQVSVNGNPVQAPLTATVTVQARPWRWNASSWQYTQGAAAICDSSPFNQNSPTLLGWNRRPNTCAGGRITPYPPEVPNQGYTIQQVTAGPNAGLWYVTSVTFRMDMQSNLNPTVLSSSSYLYTLVDKADKRECSKGGVTGTAVNFYNYNASCRKTQVANFIAALWQHEGFGVSNNSGHEAQGRLAASDPANDVHRMVERVFDDDEPDMNYNTSNEAYLADQRISSISSSHAFVKDNWCGSLWVWSTSTTKFVYGPILASGQCV